MKDFRSIFFVGLLLLITFLPGVSSFAQDDASFAQTVMDNAFAACANIGRDLVCLGSAGVTLEATEPVVFSQAGDVVDVGVVQSLAGTSINVNDNSWAMAVMQIQANMATNAPDNAVTLIAYGDFAIESSEAVPPSIMVTPTGGINVRSGPSTNYAIVTGLTPNETLVANGRNEAGDWLRILLPATDTQEEQLAWVYAPLFTTEGDVQNLTVVEPEDGLGRPLQSVTLRTGTDDHSGLLVQAPADAESARMTINGANIVTDGTLFLQANAQNGMDIAVIVGVAYVTTGDVTRKVVTGTGVTLPIGQNLALQGEPEALEPYDTELVRAQPVGMLPRGAVVSDAMDRETVRLINDVAEAAAVADPTLLKDEVDQIVQEGTNGTWLYADDCAAFSRVQAGEAVFFLEGYGGFEQRSQIIASLTGQSGIVTLDGEDLDVFYFGIDEPPGEGVQNNLVAMWIATPGQHTVSIGWTGRPLRTCEFVVAE